MEINKQNFDNICVLVQNGFEIVGLDDSGITIEYSTAVENAQKLAELAITNGCDQCQCHAPKGNCHPTVDDSVPATIYSKLN